MSTPWQFHLQSLVCTLFQPVILCRCHLSISSANRCLHVFLESLAGVVCTLFSSLCKCRFHRVHFISQVSFARVSRIFVSRRCQFHPLCAVSHAFLALPFPWYNCTLLFSRAFAAFPSSCAWIYSHQLTIAG